MLIEAACEEEAGVLVDDNTHDDLKSIMEANDSNIMSLNSADSFRRIFWDQQKQAAAVNNAKHEMAPKDDQVVFIPSTSLQ